MHRIGSGTLPASSAFKFNFEFSIPIQDTFPITRDPNRFPIADVEFSASTISRPNPPPPNHLTTVNVDVQNHIMAFLSRQDLSSLMRTCRYFLDACLLSLCGRSGALLYDDGLTRLPSFCRFLRINAGPSSRAHLIKKLWIAGRDNDSKYYYDDHLIRVREQWSAAFLDILRHCHNLRRLRVEGWFLKDVSFCLLTNTIASALYHLEHLMIHMPYMTKIDIFRRFAHLPLRSLSFMKYSHIFMNMHPTHVSLDGLPRSLVELDIHGCTSVARPFPMVQKLAIQEVSSEIFVASATATFPNVTHLILRHNSKMAFLHHGRNGWQHLDDARTRNKPQWQGTYHDAWPLLSAIWAYDPSTLYAFGFSRPVSCVSIPLDTGRRGEQAPYVAPVLVDTSPTLLELRANMDEFRSLNTPPDWYSHFGSSASSVLHLTLFLYTRHVRVADEHRVVYMLDILTAMLPAFPSLTHLLVRFAPVPQPPGIVPGWMPARAKNIPHSTIQDCLRTLADVNTSLRWVGYEIHASGLRSWDVLRHERAPQILRVEGPELIELSKSAGLAVVNAGRMKEFKDVTPLLGVLF